MLVKGSLVTQMSGSLGGITAARNKGGQYFRQRSLTTNPNSPAQVAVRTQLQALATAYTETLTEAQRDAWRQYAANVTVTNALGDAVTLSAQNWYIACNTPRVRVGLTRVDDAPTTYDLAQLNPVTLAVANDLSPGFDTGQAWVDDPEAALIVQQGRSQNASISFFKGPFRQAGIIQGDDTTPPTSPGTLTPVFPLTTGQAAYIRVRLSLSDGRLSPPQIVRAIVQPP